MIYNDLRNSKFLRIFYGLYKNSFLTQNHVTKKFEKNSHSTDSNQELVGTLTLSVNEGRGLKQKLKYGGTGFGTLDSFVTVRLDKQSFQTQTVKKSTSPNWGETFIVYISKHHKNVEVTVWDDHVVAKPGEFYNVVDGRIFNKYFILLNFIAFLIS